MIILCALVLNCIIFVTILLFLKFHIDLILRNYTTLETLELKRQSKDADKVQSEYDIGKYYNWTQVFGKNSWTWWLPVFLGSSGPSGDGVIWPKRVSSEWNHSERNKRMSIFSKFFLFMIFHGYFLINKWPLEICV